MFSGRRRGSRCVVQAGVVDLGHRPPSGPGPQDGPVLSEGGGTPGVRRRRPRTRWPGSWRMCGPGSATTRTCGPRPCSTRSSLGYPLSYPSFVRQVRAAGLRPHCEACAGVRGRETIEIDHPAGEEIQWDWFERRRAPWGGTAYVLLGTLSHSGRTRGVLAETMDQAHLIEAMDAVMRRLGGTARQWRTDRLATVIVPGSTGSAGQLRAGGQALRGGRGGLPAAAGEPQGVGGVRGEVLLRPVVADHDRHGSAEAAQCRWTGSGRPPATPDCAARPVSASYRPTGPGRPADGGRTGRRRGADGPAGRRLTRPRSRPPSGSSTARATVAFRGNRYSVPPGVGGLEVTRAAPARHATVEVFTPAGHGVGHATGLAPAGAGMIVRTERAPRRSRRSCWPSSSTARPCDRKANRPPGDPQAAGQGGPAGASGDRLGRPRSSA